MSARSARLAALVVAACALRGAAQAPGDLAGVLTRVSERVEDYYRRAQSIVCLETVHVQPLGFDMQADGQGRTLEYDLRVSWDPAPDGGTSPEATVQRQLLRVNGRPPRPNAEPACMDPRTVSPEPLSMMLRGHQDEYTFSLAGSGRTRGRPAVQLDYRPRAVGKPEVTWRGDCFSVSLPGRTKGRVWVDESTNDVLRIDESLTGYFDYRIPREHSVLGSPTLIEIQRADSSISYRAMTFHDPDEVVMVPDTIESLQIVQGAGSPRVRTTQSFSNYRRFVTEARIVR